MEFVVAGLVAVGTAGGDHLAALGLLHPDRRVAGGAGLGDQVRGLAVGAADADALARIEGEGLVAFRYCDANGVVSPETNCNGSVNSIAGIYSEKRNVLGMMPHPENLIEPLNGGLDGRPLFESLLAA